MTDRRSDSPGDTLTAVEAALATKRRAEAELLLLAADWADQHPGDTVGRSGHTPRGGEQAVRIGGEGTPRVAEFSPAELAISLEVHPLAARSLMATPSTCATACPARGYWSPRPWPSPTGWRARSRGAAALSPPSRPARSTTGSRASRPSCPSGGC